jgi:hypothetical protein
MQLQALIIRLLGYRLRCDLSSTHGFVALTGYPSNEPDTSLIYNKEYVDTQEFTCTHV